MIREPSVWNIIVASLVDESGRISGNALPVLEGTTEGLFGLPVFAKLPQTVRICLANTCSSKVGLGWFGVDSRYSLPKSNGNSEPIGRKNVQLDQETASIKHDIAAFSLEPCAIRTYRGRSTRDTPDAICLGSIRCRREGD